MSKEDLENLLKLLTYANYKVRRKIRRQRQHNDDSRYAPYDMLFRISDYRTSIEHAKRVRQHERHRREVDERIAKLQAGTALACARDSQ